MAKAALSAFMAFVFQRNNYTCGREAFRNAVQCLGIDLDARRARKLVGTTKHGTSIRGLLRGAKALELKTTEYRQTNPLAAWRWLLRWAPLWPIIILVDGCLNDDGSHWVAVTGCIGERVIVVDSAPRLKQGENGVAACDREQIIARWKQRICYGIRLSR